MDLLVCTKFYWNQQLLLFSKQLTSLYLQKKYSFSHRDYVPFIVLMKVIFSMFINRYLPPFHGHSATTLKIVSSNFNCLITFSDMRIRRVCFYINTFILKNRWSPTWSDQIKSNDEFAAALEVGLELELALKLGCMYFLKCHSASQPSKRVLFYNKNQLHFYT